MMKNVKTSISDFESDFNEADIIRFNTPSFIHERSYWLFLFLRSLECYNAKSNKLLQERMLESYNELLNTRNEYLDDFIFQLNISLASRAEKRKNNKKLNNIYFSPNFLLIDTCENLEPEPLDFFNPLIENSVLSLDSAIHFSKIFLLGVNPSKPNEVKCKWDGTKETLIVFLVCSYFTNILFVGDNKYKTHRKKDQTTEEYCEKDEPRPMFKTLIKNHFIFTKYKYDETTIHRNIDAFYDYILELQKLTKDGNISQRDVLIDSIKENPPDLIVNMSKKLSNNFLSTLYCIPKKK